MGYKAIKLLMDNNRKPKAELIEKCKMFLKYGMLNEAEYDELMAELKAEV